MKIQGEFILREVAGESLLIPTGQTALKMNGMIIIDRVGAYIWQLIEKGDNEEKILGKILERFEIDRDTAEKDMNEFLDKLNSAGLLCLD